MYFSGCKTGLSLLDTFARVKSMQQGTCGENSIASGKL